MLRIPLIAAVFTAALLAPGATTAAEAPAVAWTVETVDSANGANRANFSYAVDPGTNLTDTMRVTNTGTTALDLAVYAADAYTTPVGNIDLHTTDQPSIDAGTWVTAETSQLILQPGEQSDIDFTIAVPADAAPGDHSAGLITSFRSATDQATIDVDRRLGTRITVRVSGELAPRVSVTEVQTTYRGSWNPFEPGAVVVSYRLTNAGNTLVTGTDATTAAGLGLFGASAEPIVLPEVIPGSTVDVVREIPVAPWGWVSGSVVTEPEAIGIGAQGLAAVTHEYGVLAVPWTLLIVLAVIALIVVGMWTLRRRRRAASGSEGQEV
ncbi:DUF916 domain-containing protein [Microbacterium aoyamense]|uniref:DUF916 domain-containing protein n=1 Tax=Microbacterium aoyamense TaxID=344166 RepID=A0ABN2PIL2_9MICO|nr:DUF916 domain-containing protein [Microbacterium aoyamense]